MYDKKEEINDLKKWNTITHTLFSDEIEFEQLEKVEKREPNDDDFTDIDSIDWDDLI